jgi:pyridoxal phosphate enzyme (YggS family)
LRPAEPVPILQGFVERYSAVRARIASAAARAGRDPASVVLVGASKTVEAGRLREAVAAGLSALGENRVQEARDKIAELEDLKARVHWHLIGHLQSNKAKLAATLFDWVHSVDSEDLARELDRRAAEAGKKLSVLVEVNTSGEQSKFGVAPAAVLGLLNVVTACSALEPRGLMTVGPLTDDVEASRSVFRELARLLGEAQRAFPGARLDQLSTGMSADFEIAIEEGATIVRVGTALFGPRAAKVAKTKNAAQGGI